MSTATLTMTEILDRMTQDKPARLKRVRLAGTGEMRYVVFRSHGVIGFVDNRVLAAMVEKAMLVGKAVEPFGCAVYTVTPYGRRYIAHIRDVRAMHGTRAMQCGKSGY